MTVTVTAIIILALLISFQCFDMGWRDTLGGWSFFLCLGSLVGILVWLTDVNEPVLFSYLGPLLIVFFTTLGILVALGIEEDGE